MSVSDYHRTCELITLLPASIAGVALYGIHVISYNAGDYADVIHYTVSLPVKEDKVSGDRGSASCH